MWYQYRRINARGEKELHYTQDINVALVYDRSPEPCEHGPWNEDSFIENVTAGLCAAGIVFSLLLAFWGPEIFDFYEEYDGAIIGVCIVVLFGTAIAAFNKKGGGG